MKKRMRSPERTYHLLILLLVTRQTTRYSLVETRFPLCLLLAEVTHVAQPFSTARVDARFLREDDVGMAFEEVARVFFDDGVEVLVCCREGVERVGGERGIKVGLGVGEDGEEDFWWESVEVRHAGMGMRNDFGGFWCCDNAMRSLAALT